MALGAIRLVDGRGRKYLTAAKREGFLPAAAREPKPERRTLALTLAHSGARLPGILALRPLDPDAAAIRTLERHTGHRCEGPPPPEALRALEIVHGPRGVPARRTSTPLRPSFRATGHRFVVSVMRRAGISGPQVRPKGLRHAVGIAAVAAGVPLPTIAAVPGHAGIATTAIRITAVGIEARALLSRMWTGTPPAFLLRGSPSIHKIQAIRITLCSTDFRRRHTRESMS